MIRPLEQKQVDVLYSIAGSIVDSGLYESYATAIETRMAVGTGLIEYGVQEEDLFSIRCGEEIVEDAKWALRANGLFVFGVNCDPSSRGRLVQIEMVKVEPESSSVFDESSIVMGRVGVKDRSYVEPMETFSDRDVNFATQRLPLLDIFGLRYGDHMPWLVYGDIAADMSEYAENLATRMRGLDT